MRKIVLIILSFVFSINYLSSTNFISKTKKVYAQESTKEDRDSDRIVVKKAGNNLTNDKIVIYTKATKYPTKWTHIATEDRRYNKKARKAGKAAFASALTSFLTGKVTNPKVLALIAAAQYGTYYFVNTDEQNVYFSMKYYYRLIAKRKPDINGIDNKYIEMKRVTKISRYKNLKNGQTKIETRKTNQIWIF